jgi:hypothetical protein
MGTSLLMTAGLMGHGAMEPINEALRGFIHGTDNI